MPSTTLNFITTTLLTLFCAITLLVTYRHAIRPILTRYNIPLQSLPSFLGRRSRGWMDAQYRRMNPDDDGVDRYNDHDDDGENIDASESEDVRRERRTSRDLEEGFRDDSDDEDEAQQGEGRRHGGGGNDLREVAPRPLEDERRFPAARI